jgi:hypothetical protein
MFNIEWTNQCKPVLDTHQEKHLHDQIAQLSKHLIKASDLVFYTVFLTDEIQGASVHIGGVKGVDDTLFLTYYENTKWTTSDEMEN